MPTTFMVEFQELLENSEKRIASIHGNFLTFTCIHTLCLQKCSFLYETGFLLAFKFFTSHFIFVFWAFFCFLSESIDCERKSLDFKGHTWNRGKCGDIRTYIHNYIQESQMRLALGTGNPGWLHQSNNLYSIFSFCYKVWLHQLKDRKNRRF